VKRGTTDRTDQKAFMVLWEAGHKKPQTEKISLEIILVVWYMVLIANIMRKFIGEKKC
jgi:hypothetical protein